MSVFFSDPTSSLEQPFPRLGWRFPSFVFFVLQGPVAVRLFFPFFLDPFRRISLSAPSSCTFSAPEHQQTVEPFPPLCPRQHPPSLCPKLFFGGVFPRLASPTRITFFSPAQTAVQVRFSFPFPPRVLRLSRPPSLRLSRFCRKRSVSPKGILQEEGFVFSRRFRFSRPRLSDTDKIFEIRPP